jgi:hypothetical protein
MSRETGFLQLRRGIFEHVRDGRLSITGALAFIYVCSEADTRTGIWKGCAKSLSGELGIPERTARDVLEKMEHGDYIRRFAIPGRHVCYPILIHKYPISQGEHNGEQLNALESVSPAELSYFPREHSVERNGEHGVEHGAAQRILETRNKRLEKKKEAPAVPSLSFSGLHFSITEKQDALLGEAFPWIDRPVEYRKVDSWLEANPERRPKKSSRFLHNWFSRIAQPKEGTNGNQNISAEERIRQGDIAAARFLENNCGVAANLRPSAVPAKPDPKAVN